MTTNILRRTFALIMSICMLLSCCFVAEGSSIPDMGVTDPGDLSVNSCDHPEAMLTYTTVSTATEYKEINSIQHTVSVVEYVDIYCNNCNSFTAQGKRVVHSTDYEDHAYENSVCVNGCGAVCDHPQSFLEYTPVSKATEYEEIDNLNHIVINVEYVDIYCHNCNSYTATDHRVELSSYIDGHTYENGVCIYCEHVNTCVHPEEHRNVHATDSYSEHSQIDDKYHTNTYVEKYNIYCDACHSYIAWDQKNEIQQGNGLHVMNNDTCVHCGYVNPCTHPDEGCIENTNWIYIEKYEPNDALTHTVTGSYEYSLFCTACEFAAGPVTLHENTTKTEVHLITDGVCERCNAPCQHPEEALYQEFISSEEKYTSFGDHEHLYYVTNSYVDRCSWCGEIVSEEYSVLDEDSRIYSPHDYSDGYCPTCEHSCSHDFEDNICTICGMEICLHPEESLYTQVTYSGAGTYTAIDETMHVYSGPKVDWIYCSLCGRKVREENYVENYTEERSHVFENGKCSICGYECTHPEDHIISDTYFISDVNYSGITDTHHTANGEMNEETWCDNCGHSLETVEHGITSVTEEHTFENNVCTACGFERACPHPEEAQELVSGIDVSEYESIDKEYHSYTGTLISRWYCYECNEYISEPEYTEGYTDTETHSFDDGVCIQCGYECDHDEEYVYTETIWEEGYTCEPYDEYDHKCIGAHSTVDVCGNCGTELSAPVAGETGYVLEQHSFYEHECTECGYVCQHPEDYLEKSSGIYDESCEKLDDKYHSWSYTLETNIFCNFCNYILDDSTTIENVVEKEEHEFGSDGICVYCGAENTCEHPEASITSSDYMRADSYEDYNATHHYCIGTLVEYTTCEDCGMQLTYEETYVDDYLEEHYFSDGFCVYCDRENTCKHPENELVCIFYLTDIEYEYIDETYHLETGTQFMDTYCAVCDEHISTDKIADNVSEYDLHYIGSDGTCSCGYTIECTHPDDKLETNTYRHIEGYEYADERYHTVTYDRRMDTYCLVCNAMVDSTLLVNDMTMLNAHDFEDGVCEDCGYDPECDHPDEYVSSWYYDTGRTVTYKDEDSHTVSINGTYYTEECEYCESVISVEKVSDAREYTEPHSFSWGVCDCGYAPVGCEHTNTYKHTTIISLSYAHHDEVYHSATQQLKIATICADCDLTLSYEYSEEFELLRKHTFDGGDYCDICYYANTCEHPEGRRRTNTYFLTGMVEVTVKDITADTHTVTGTLVTETYCTDCDSLLSTRETMDTVTDEHDFQHGKCRICGYKNTCSHENTTVENKLSTVYGVEEITKTTHTASGSYYKYTICDDCGEELSKDIISPNGKVTEEHRYENGFCDVCGYPQPNEGGSDDEGGSDQPVVDDKPITDNQPTIDDHPIGGDEYENNVETGKADDIVIGDVTTGGVHSGLIESEDDSVVSGAKTGDELDLIDTLAVIAATVTAEGEAVIANAPELTLKDVVSVTITGIEFILTEDELTAHRELSIEEQLLTAVYFIGFDEVVTAWAAETGYEFSPEAAALMEGYSLRVSEMDEEEKAAHVELMTGYFPMGVITIDGIEYDFFILETEITVGDVIRCEGYGFRFDETTGEWLLTRLYTR